MDYCGLMVEKLYMNCLKCKSLSSQSAIQSGFPPFILLGSNHKASVRLLHPFFANSLLT